MQAPPKSPLAVLIAAVAFLGTGCEALDAAGGVLDQTQAGLTDASERVQASVDEASATIDASKAQLEEIQDSAEGTAAQAKGIGESAKDLVEKPPGS
ncbi:MAG: hypothetical protein AAF682_22065 [Planctomycetota bacterium]